MSLEEETDEGEKEETPVYLEILQPVHQQQLEEASGYAVNILAGCEIEEDENIYDNDDCFPPEFIAKMKSKYKTKPPSSGWEAQQGDGALQHLLQPNCYLSSSASSTDYENDSDSDLNAEVDQFQLSMRTSQTPQEGPKRISALLEALDLPPVMRGRSAGLNRQQARRAKQIIGQSRKKVPVMPEGVRGAAEEKLDRDVSGCQECCPEENWQGFMSPPRATDYLSQQQKLESFEQTLEAHGTPYTEKTRPTPSAAFRREQFTRSTSTPSKPPSPSISASGRGKLQIYSSSAWSKSRTMLENTSLPSKDKKSKKVKK